MTILFPTPTSTTVDTDRAASDTLTTSADARCAACEHDLTAHDRVGKRYCEATLTNVLPRGCICAFAG